jgi:2-keto-4-pentenoate hydratase
MKKIDFKDTDADNFESDDMLPEYRFDYRKARPNRFTAEVVEGSLIVVLEPEIARVFRTQETVKEILRAIAKTLPAAQQESQAVSS